MNKLYPLKFKPQYKSKIWGGQRIAESLCREDAPKNEKIGESWEVSGLSGNASVVANGFLAENDLSELLEIYMEDLVGEKTYATYGNEFPLLVKFIDSNDALSVQVHPHHITDDKGKVLSFGKNEMWYVMDADPGSSLTVGFEKDTSPEEVAETIRANKLTDIIHTEAVKPGDVFYIPTGRLHAIGKGILICEIQQSCDTTYRLYDWGRNAKDRALHIAESLEVLDFKKQDNYKSEYSKEGNKLNPICNTPYFTTNYLKVDSRYELDLTFRDSFTLLVCLEGQGELAYESGPTSAGGNGRETFRKGDSMLIPASIAQVRIESPDGAIFLETHID